MIEGDGIIVIVEGDGPCFVKMFLLQMLPLIIKRNSMKFRYLINVSQLRTLFPSPVNH